MTDTIPAAILLQIFEKSAACLLMEANDPEFTIVSASDAYLKVTGLVREHIIGKAAFELFPDLADDPSGANQTRNAIRQAIATKKQTGIAEYAYYIPHPETGAMEEFWWSSTFDPILDEIGQVTYVLGTAIDLTEKVRVRNLLNQSENKFRALVNDAPVAMALISGNELIFEVVNAEMLQLLGKGPEIIGQSYLVALPEMLTQPYLEFLHTVMSNGLPYRQLEAPAMLIKNGIPEHGFYNFTYQPIKDDKGNTKAVLALAVDVTEMVKARLLLQESYQAQRQLNEVLASTNEKQTAANEELTLTNAELARIQQTLHNTIAELGESKTNLLSERERLKRFFLQAPAGICVLGGPDLIFELVNPRYQQLFPGRELMGKPMLAAVPEVRGAPIWDVLQDVYQTGNTFEGNELLIPLARTEEGPVEDRYFNFIYQARHDAGGQVDGILVFVIEVTETVRTKQKIEQNAEFLRAQLNALPLIAWTNTAEGEVDFYNQQWYDYSGLNFEETKNWGWKQVIHPDDLEYNIRSYQTILAGDKSGEFEIREKRKDGEYRWHLVRMQPIKDDAGRIDRWIGTATDVHDLKQLQQQKDDFISIASHELKTPVTSLKASLQLLDRMKDQPSPVLLPRLIEQASRSIGKISALIEDLLDVGRLNESQLHIRKQLFNVSDLLSSCSSHVRAFGNHEVVFQGDPDLQVFADENRIEQVVTNLVNNAVKYAPQSKRIYLISERLPGFIKVSVRDNGPGIAPDKLPHLFHKYYRAEYAGTQNSGMGLGLYISSEIVRRHGGEIGVNSEIGKGSTFWFTLPVEVAQ